MSSAKLVTAICDRALPPGVAPEWVHLLPEGRMNGRDGRVFELADPGALVLDFQSRGVDLPIDYEHQSERSEAKANGPVPAAGWIKELRADPGGLWGRVEWTATAREMISRKEYRYLSPAFLHHPKSGVIVRLTSAGLVHKPNLNLVALASQEPPMNLEADKAKQSGLLARLAKMLGLDEDAAEDDIMARLSEALIQPRAVTASQVEPDPAKYVPLASVQAMLRERNEERAIHSANHAIEKVDRAVREHYLPPSLKNWALALCKSDEASLDAFLKTTGPSLSKLFVEIMPNGYPSASGQLGGSAEEMAICAQLGLKPGALRS